MQCEQAGWEASISYQHSATTWVVQTEKVHDLKHYYLALLLASNKDEKNRKIYRHNSGVLLFLLYKMSEYIKWKDLQYQIPLRTDQSKKREILFEKPLCSLNCTYDHENTGLYFQITCNPVDVLKLICMKISGLRVCCNRKNSLNLSKKMLQLAGVLANDKTPKNSSINHLVWRVFIKYKMTCVLFEALQFQMEDLQQSRGLPNLNWTWCEQEIKLSGIICSCSTV